MSATLQRIVIACGDVETMARFYEAVFGVAFERVEEAPFALFNGDLGGVTLCLLPADVAGIEAEENRHQLTLGVDSLEAVVDQATAHGGSVLDAIARRGDSRVCSLRDPDGNSIECVERR